MTPYSIKMAKLVVLIAGNICTGKSELCQYIQQQKQQFAPFLDEGEKVHTVYEFIDPLALELFYHDRKGNSEIFEESCLVARKTRHLKAKNDGGIYFFDRGMIEGAETFSKNSFLDGYLSHQAHENYIKSLQRGLDRLDRSQQQRWLEQLVVYLRVEDVDTLMERRGKRATAGESIPKEYLQRINDLYDKFISDIDSVYSQYAVRAPRVVEVNASTDFNDDKQYHARTLEQIINIMKEMKIDATR